MKAESRKSATQDRGVIKRRLLLAAATECFRRDGFHNARISQICKAAHMSVGQVYHYFENKEAIIAACVEQELEGVFAMFESFERADNVAEALVKGPSNAPMVDPVIMLEVYAEAGRNPTIAKLMRKVDEELRSRFLRVLTLADAERGVPDAPDRELRAEAMLAVPMGMQVRRIANPAISIDQLRPMMQRAFRAILEG